MIKMLVMLILLGLIFGSFVNALVWRLSMQDELCQKERSRRYSREGGNPVKKKQLSSNSILKNPAFFKWRIHDRAGNDERTNGVCLDENKQDSNEDYSILHGRSMCPECHHTLAAKDLVPVFSWLMLRGKCRYCHRPISWQYPLVEVVTAMAFGLSYAALPHSNFVDWTRLSLWLVAVVIFMALAVYDLRWYLLPNRLVYPLVGVAIAYAILGSVSGDIIKLLLEAAISAAIFYGLFRLIYEVSKQQWIGYGDVRLAVALGLLVSTPFGVLLNLFVASLTGLIVSLPLLLSKGKDSLKYQIPFGPYLILGCFVVVLYGPSFMRWYFNIVF